MLVAPAKNAQKIEPVRKYTGKFFTPIRMTREKTHVIASMFRSGLSIVHATPSTERL